MAYRNLDRVRKVYKQRQLEVLEYLAERGGSVLRYSNTGSFNWNPIALQETHYDEQVNFGDYFNPIAGQLEKIWGAVHIIKCSDGSASRIYLMDRGKERMEKLKAELCVLV